MHSDSMTTYVTDDYDDEADDALACTITSECEACHCFFVFSGKTFKV